MSDTVINVENLSKRFLLSHQPQERYASMRDTFSKTIKGFFGRESKNATTSDEFWALRDVSFEIKKGDRVGIIGRNGAGKSTLLKILSRITEPTKGRITIKGRVASLLEVGTGFHPELSGRENIYLNGTILGMSREEIKKKFDEIAAFAEVERFLDTPVKRYSSGMYVRLAFAVAAHLEPEILIVDEVLAVGDVEFQKKCLGKMEDVSKGQGRTILFVSHNMGIISKLCNQAIYLKSGKLHSQGLSHELLALYSSNDDKKNEGYSHKDAPEYFVSEVFVEIDSKQGFLSSAQDVTVNIQVHLPRNLPGLHLGLALIDKWKRKLFTTVYRISKRKSECKYERFRVTIPANLLLSGCYSIDVSSFIPNGVSYCYLKDICPFEINDFNSELSIYGGQDVGVIQVACQWH